MTTDDPHHDEIVEVDGFDYPRALPRIEDEYLLALKEPSGPSRDALLLKILNRKLGHICKGVRSSHPLARFGKNHDVPYALATAITEKAKRIDFDCEDVIGDHYILSIMSGQPALHTTQDFTPQEALNLVAEAFSCFHPEMGKAARDIIDQKRYDFSRTPMGPLCYVSVPDGSESWHPPQAKEVCEPYRGLSFVSISLRNDPRIISLYDLWIIAHEMGHGVMSDLAHHTSGTVTPSIPLAEFGAILAEKIVAHFLMEKSQDPLRKYRKPDIAQGFCQRINELLDCGRMATLQHNLINITRDRAKGTGKGPKKPLELAEVTRATQGVFPGRGQQWKEKIHLLDPAYYYAAYVLASIASQEVFERWVKGDEQTAEEVLRMMKNGKLKYARAMRALGTDVSAPGFLEESIEKHRYFDRVAMEALTDVEQEFPGYLQEAPGKIAARTVPLPSVTLIEDELRSGKGSLSARAAKEKTHRDTKRSK